MQHNAPHRLARFEGYYSKFDLPAGGHIALVLCRVRHARTRPYMLSFTYIPPSPDSPIFQRELWPEELTMPCGPDHTFSISVPSIGTVSWAADHSITYDLHHPDFTFTGRTTSHTPWSRRTANSTPESWLVYLPLPLHWHVHTLASTVPYTLTLPSSSSSPSAAIAALDPAEASGTALLHQEKNWALSYPAAHIWLQARAGTSSLTLAGGRILGLEAFLLGYRSAHGREWDFRPPWSVRFVAPSLIAADWAWGPCTTFAQSWEGRNVRLGVAGLGCKIEVEAKAEKGTWFSLSAPFEEGHRENALGQSFRARVRVRVYERCWWRVWEEWKLVGEEMFDGASLEFGGGWYGAMGSKERFH